MVIAIVVVLSIFLQKLFNPPEDKNWSNHNTTTNASAGEVVGEAALLPARSSYLDNVCGKTQLSGDSRKTCEEACAPAVGCCDPFQSGNSTCFEDHVAGCVTYSQCHALTGANDPAYSDIDRVCAMKSIEVNR